MTRQKAPPQFPHLEIGSSATAAVPTAACHKEGLGPPSVVCLCVQGQGVAHISGSGCSF